VSDAIREAFEKWAADKRFLLEINDRDGYVGCVNVEDVAWEAWQAALQSGEPVAWMHNTRKNVDVIGADVKHLFGSMAEFYGSHGVAHVDKGEHYTIPLYTTPQQVASATTGMNLGERIKHVGGRENAQGYIEFGSVMAVKALIDHVLRDLHTTPQPVVPDGYVLVPVDVIKKLQFYLEPYDDIKPRDWATDRQNLRRAHELVQALLSAGKERP